MVARGVTGPGSLQWLKKEIKKHFIARLMEQLVKIALTYYILD